LRLREKGERALNIFQVGAERREKKGKGKKNVMHTKKEGILTKKSENSAKVKVAKIRSTRYKKKCNPPKKS